MSYHPPVRTTLFFFVLALPALAGEVEDMVKQLGDDSYEKREAAEKRLEEIGEPALPALRAAAESEDAEVRAKAPIAGERPSGGKNWWQQLWGK